MSEQKFHRGIGYSVRHFGQRRWKWEIHPPDSVKGMKLRTGEVEGTQTDAIAAATKEIDAQQARISN